MSRSNSPRKGSPLKHKGMMTSLYNNQQQYGQRIENKLYTTNPSRIYVQTITQQPNVLPYINSGYNTQPQVVGQISYHYQRQAQSQYVIVNQRQNNLMSTTTRPQIVTNVRVSPVIGGQNLSRTKLQSAHYQSRLPQGNASTYVPPPPESFLIPNSATKVIENRSMGKTVIQSVPVPSIIPSQSVKKTFIPHHIINEIPVYSGTIYTESGYRSSSQQRQSQHQQQQQQAQGNNDQSQQVLMGYYQKLYTKYEQEKQHSAAINQQLSQAVNEINYLKSQLQQQQSMIHTNIVSQPPIQKKKIIDKRKLYDLLMSKMSPIIDQVVERRKENCLRQVTNTVQSHRVTIKIPGQFQKQQSQFVYYPR